MTAMGGTMTTQEMRDRMDQLTGQIMRSLDSDEPFDSREQLWMEREALRDALTACEALIT